ncbi:hypothetical protein C0995_000430 [Termitomyces sp. Mi166|nr:hypothetical protein C0995_000430 [Termitomyces sp. Mi166\
MVTKISLLNISADASLLKHERTTQDFINAANTVFIKAQGLAMLAPLHEMLHSELSLQEQEEVCALTLLPTQEQPSQWVPPHSKGKGKAKAMEENNDKEGEATQRLREELENFVAPTKFDNLLLAGLLPLPTEYYEEDIGLP